jgi:hypothetical protein
MIAANSASDAKPWFIFRPSYRNIQEYPFEGRYRHSESLKGFLVPDKMHRKDAMG